jgi:hypothetical protein
MAPMFTNFPKSRPPLPPEYQPVYKRYYRENREGRSTATGMSRRMEGWMHRKVAEDVRQANAPMATLEIGAGTLNHLPYEPNAMPYDIVEPFAWSFERSPLLARVRHKFRDMAEVPLDLKYDRIVSIATFEHVANLPTVVAKSGLLLKEGGALRVGIPSEGTLAWRLAWTLTTGLEFRLRYGLRYGVLMRHEHLNTAEEIHQVLGHFFSHITCKVFGISRRLSLYQVLFCSEPRIAKCEEYLGEDLITKGRAAPPKK